ncbi:MAG: aminopeptidase [Pseudomonadota bacterium]
MFQFSRLLVWLLALSLLEGCYYMQAASGQWEVLRKREPVSEVINDPDTSPQLAARLQLLADARDFSIRELGLPDNDSYRTYADLEREFVVWNVIAAPEFSLEPRTWCYPVAGCVSYRGYFKRDSALKAAGKLRDDGYDVAVGGVSAYSTLGKFDDPILNTMMQRDDVELVALLFHELAHQVLYVKGDTGFNESFATAVEEFGVLRWLEYSGRELEYTKYTASREFREGFMQMVDRTRRDLEHLYARDIGDDEKRSIKRKRLMSFAEHANGWAKENGRDLSGWLGAQPNNAHLVSTTLYQGRLPEFRDMLAQCNDDLECFYEMARQRARAESE